MSTYRLIATANADVDVCSPEVNASLNLRKSVVDDLERQLLFIRPAA